MKPRPIHLLSGGAAATLRALIRLRYREICREYRPSTTRRPCTSREILLGDLARLCLELGGDWAETFGEAPEMHEHLRMESMRIANEPAPHELLG